MKHIFIKRLIISGVVVLAIPAAVFAQKEDKEKNNKEEVQQIIITRKGAVDDKTLIEINGEKVKINGKDIDNLKDQDVTVNINKFNGMDNINNRLRNLQHPGVNTWNFNDNNFNLFSEDENRAMLGVVTDESDKGAVISEVSTGSAAAKAGLKRGDVITKIDEKKIENASDVSESIHSHKPGEKVVISILRDDNEKKITVELGKWKGLRMQSNNMPLNRLIAPDVLKNMPKAAPTPFEFDNDFSFEDRPKLGMSIQDTEDGKGVKVIDIDDDSNAAKAGIKEDDIIMQVNDKEVNSADEISRIIRENRAKSSFTFKVQRSGKIQTIEVRMPRKIKTVDL